HIDIKTKLYTDTGHLMHWDRPEEIAEDVLHWFK
ncbi:TPA: alpha/beta hydrolase, partial [Bacillus paranthracis]